jgi:16S rRNA (guanine527-N7)-methyltransferase
LQVFEPFLKSAAQFILEQTPEKFMSIESQKISVFNEIKKFFPLNEAQEKNFEDFVAALLLENGKFNFIGKSTIDSLWERHILDSAQLLPLIKTPNAKFADLGSGAGFPGIVLSILGVKEIHLVEKSFRKADFLRRAKGFSQNRIFVHQANLEDLKDIKFDCIVSRALAPLPKLLEYSKKFLEKDGYCLFLKGKNLNNEIITAKNSFQFEYELHPSLTSSESNIIKIFNIS